VADLRVESVAIAIRGRELVSSATFMIESGGCLGLVGETGCGKTLTCRLLSGTLGRVGGSVTRGTATFGDDDLGAMSEREWRRLRGRRVGLVPQNSLSGLDPVMTVQRQLTETIRELGDSDAPKRSALELLGRVRIPRATEVLKSYPHELSGGMRQRVMIALALIGRPHLLVADEPTTALDVTVQREILRLLSDLRRETGMTLIMVTHDLGVVEETADRIAVMYGGMTVETGPSAALFRNPGHPYTRALLAARPGAQRPGQRLADIPGFPPSPEEWPGGCRFAARCVFSQRRCVGRVPELSPFGADQLARCVRVEELAHGA
jgi:oligopeptide/dipeptide ABC transporter ATP-binding protein